MRIHWGRRYGGVGATGRPGTTTLVAMMVTALTWMAVVCALAIGTRFLSRWLLARDARIAVRRAAMLSPASVIDPSRGRPRPWIIVNPSKHADVGAFRRHVDAIAQELGITGIHWLETTIEDPGTGQAVHAVHEGASTVIAAGGDGTVRAVAAGLAGSGVRMGILPVGTGNLLARNLSLPIDDTDGALRIALGSEHRLVDLGWLRIANVESTSTLPPEGMLLRSAYASLRTSDVIEELPDYLPATDEYSFVVIAGLGFDGETMATTDPELKKRIGWVAYVVAALGVIVGGATRLRLLLRGPLPVSDPVGDAPAKDETSHVVAQSATLGGHPLTDSPREDEVAWITARTIMFANCGDLPYITLAPGARIDDGLVDVIAVNAQAGVLGWADLSWKILGQKLGIKTMNLPTSTGHISFRQAEGASVTAQSAQVIQVDGDAVGTARTVHVRIDQGVLDVSVPPAPDIGD